MNERQKTIIELFHSTHSLLRTCREDLSVMIQQHNLGTLLVDRITESARRMDSALEAMPHMTALIEAIDSPALTDEQFEKAYEPEGDPIPDEAVPEEPDLVEGLRATGLNVKTDEDLEPADEPPAYRTGAEKRAHQAELAAREDEDVASKDD